MDTRFGQLAAWLAAPPPDWPQGVAVACRSTFGPLPGLFPDEESAVRGAMDKRRLEFSAGRAAARAALAQIGVAAGPIPCGPDRAAVWPAGVAASITHAGGVAVAVAAHNARAAGLGVDIEPLRELAPELARRIAAPSELAALAAPPGLAALRLFSLKEAAYKAQYALSRRFLDFDAAQFGPDGLHLVLDAPPLAHGQRLPAWQWTVAGLCLSLCVVDAPARPNTTA